MKKNLTRLSLLSLACVSAAGAFAQSWTAVAAPGGCSAFSMFQLTDGSIMVGSEYSNSAAWYKYTPSATGSYTAGGTWTALATSPTNRLYFGCGVLPDGRIPMFGGEYLNFSAVWTNRCDIYNPVTNTWQTLVPPGAMANIGDATSCVLPDGRFMFGNAYTAACQFFDYRTNAFTAAPTALNGTNEEGWIPLWNNNLISPDAVTGNRSERFNPTLNTWSFDANVPVALFTAASKEPGAGVNLPNGKVFHTGGPGTTAIFTPGATTTSNGSWVAGPAFPLSGGIQQGAEDAMVVLMPNGKALATANKASSFTGPTHLYEYDYLTNTMPQIPDPLGGIAGPCYTVHLLQLPSGQIALTQNNGQLWIYTPAGTPVTSMKPFSITSPTVCRQNDDVIITGEQINGVTCGANYGDEGYYNSNFPLVRFRSAAGPVYYTRTHDHSTMAIGPNHQRQTTLAKIPTTIPAGTYTVELVANGLQATNTPTVTVNNNANLIQGTITLQDYAFREEESGFWVTLDLIDTASNTVLETQVVHTRNDVGDYQFFTTKTSGKAIIRAKTSHWLRNVSGTFALTSANTITRNLSLLNGDVDQDNVVSILDYSILSDYFDRDETQAGWLTVGGNGFRPYDADIDGDGTVSILDYSVLSSNFDIAGA